MPLLERRADDVIAYKVSGHTPNNDASVVRCQMDSRLSGGMRHTYLLTVDRHADLVPVLGQPLRIQQDEVDVIEGVHEGVTLALSSSGRLLPATMLSRLVVDEDDVQDAARVSRFVAADDFDDDW